MLCICWCCWAKRSCGRAEPARGYLLWTTIFHKHIVWIYGLVYQTGGKDVACTRTAFLSGQKCIRSFLHFIHWNIDLHSAVKRFELDAFSCVAHFSQCIWLKSKRMSCEGIQHGYYWHLRFDSVRIVSAGLKLNCFDLVETAVISVIWCLIIRGIRFFNDIQLIVINCCH